ncbi:EF hand family protein, putative [Babesia bigemina]|uniref:Calmodulin n=1 Tax=Babesia bigemina TaxID=5866 RepID=A0A061DBJ9_BABBI|nr:EF hand family protein, putative [Babesia bigemina]CDR97302.1 EF hand family protein, putative [Babesia bigemina]|eukprot:XP_012769488.1 EF hand family protein, putative [Babesia bigemina]
MAPRPHLRLSAEHLVMFQNHFKLVDSNGDGCINQSEFRLLFRSFGQVITNKRLDQIVEEAFKNAPSTGVDFEAFVNIFVQHFTPPPTERAVREALMLFDKNNTGFIDTRELIRLLTTRGEKLEQSEVNYLFELLGIPQSTQRIDYVTFVEDIYRMLPILPNRKV